MFTGIIEATGTLREVKPMAGGFRVRIATTLASALKPGDSVAVNGVCLTAILIDAGEVHADISPETSRVSTLGGLQRGWEVNLERPVPVNGRLDGHLVLGHVDGTGGVDEIRHDVDCHWLTITYPPGLAPYFIRKGSVAVDGISLTIAGLGESQFDVQIVPFTWAHTTLKSLRARDRVNLECDMIGKYVVRALELTGQGGPKRP